MAFCYEQKIKPSIDFLYQFFKIESYNEKDFYQFNKQVGVLMVTLSSNKGWHRTVTISNDHILPLLAPR